MSCADCIILLPDWSVLTYHKAIVMEFSEMRIIVNVLSLLQSDEDINCNIFVVLVPISSIMQRLLRFQVSKICAQLC